jgi:hypothetical protein
MSYDYYSKAYQRSNRWGDTVWGNPYEHGNIPQDEFADRSPQDVIRDAFAQIGHTNRLTNPWVRYVYENIGPSANLLYTAFGNRGSGSDVRGTYDWIRGLASASTGTWNNTNRMGQGTVPGSTGEWITYDKFANLARSLAAGQGPTALQELLNAQSGEQQYETLRNLFGAAASMAMNQIGKNALLASLAEKYSDYKSRQGAGLTDDDQGFLGFLNGSGYFQRWFG